MTNNLRILGSHTQRPVEPGHYRVNAAGLSLIVEEDKIYLTGQTTNRIVFTIPLDHHIFNDPEAVSAREAVLDYVSAAWSHHDWPSINEWMEDRQAQGGIAVWQKYLIYGQSMSGELASDPNRTLIEQEVTQWLKSHS